MACENKGPDERILEPLTCAVQGPLSFRSTRAPIFLGTGSFKIGFHPGWPPLPFVAVNVRHDSKAPDAREGHKFFHFRLGWRWDAHPKNEPEKGGWYLFSVAVKNLDHKIEFWKDPPPSGVKENP